MSRDQSLGEGGYCHAPLFVGPSRAGRGGDRSSRRLDPLDRPGLPRQHLLHRPPAPAPPCHRDARPRAAPRRTAPGPRARRLLQRRRATGTLAPEPHRGGPPPALGPADRGRLTALVREQPDATLEQLRQRGGFQCSLKTLWYALDRLGLTRKKKSLHATQRDRSDVQTKRRRFRREVGQIEPKKLVFVDETGVTTAMTPAYARAPRGQLRQRGGFQCSLKTLWYALDRLGLTRKKKSLHAT